jgi:formate dehydrogenase maturation protein FdhE
MNFVVKQCKKCKEIMGACKPESLIHTANNCNGELETLNISWDELSIIEDISTDKEFLQAMIDLKEKDIIEYNLKISQFKSQLEQQKSSKTQNDNRPKCPTCGSTNIEKISATRKVVGGAMFGLFSSDVRNSMHCKNCGAKW